MILSQDQLIRKHYPGEHRIWIIVNAVEMARPSFELQEKAFHQV